MQSGNIWWSAGTTYSTAGDPGGISGFLNSSEHFLLFPPSLHLLFFLKSVSFPRERYQVHDVIACGEEGKTGAVTFSLKVRNRFLKNLSWHLWFLISLESEEVIFSDNIATEVTANEVGYVVSEEHKRLQQDQIVQ